MRIRPLFATVIVSSLLWSSAASAQQHVVAPAEMQQAIAAQRATDAENREAVLGVLHQSQVRELAGRLGLDVTRAEQAVSRLDRSELARAADSARAAEVQLAGGANNTVVISTTTLLLVLIVVILLVR